MEKNIMGIVSEMSGNVPVIVTVRDDGFADSLDGKNILPLTKRRKKNDSGTRALGLLLREQGAYCRPTLIIQNIERKRMTNSIRLHFYKRVLEATRACLERWGECYLFDLHATEKQPSFGRFDIIFGTDHRKTIFNDKNWAVDFGVAGKIEESGMLSVYLPGVEAVPGEIWSASKCSTLVKWVKLKEPGVLAIQMEIASEWFSTNESISSIAYEIFLAIKESAGV